MDYILMLSTGTKLQKVGYYWFYEKRSGGHLLDFIRYICTTWEKYNIITPRSPKFTNHLTLMSLSQ